MNHYMIQTAAAAIKNSVFAVRARESWRVENGSFDGRSPVVRVSC